MNLRDLRYLCAVAEHQHFGKAAAACFVSQPTLSAQIKKLEAHLGVQLLERDTRSVRLTEIGQEIVWRARRIITEADELMDTARQVQDPLSGHVRVGVIPTLGPYLLPQIIPALKQNLPRLELRWQENITDHTLERLQKGELDAALLALPVEQTQFSIAPLFTEPFFAALPPKHPLAQQTTISVQDLLGDNLLLLDDGHCLRDQALAVCTHVNLQPQQDFRATSLETLRQLVASGAGVTLLPQLAVQEGANNIVTRPLTDTSAQRQIGIVWRKSTAKQQAIAAVAEVIRNAVVLT